MGAKSNVVAIIVAAGSGERMGGGGQKQWLGIGGKPLFIYTAGRFQEVEGVDGLILVVKSDRVGATEEAAVKFDLSKIMGVVAGGPQRQDSVYNALKSLPALSAREDTEIVLIHDGVRPLVSPGLIERSINACRKKGAVVVALRVKDTVKRVKKGVVLDTPLRDELWLVQTPQAFRYDLILSAYEKAMEVGYYSTDDASLVERFTPNKVAVIPGDDRNIKITTRDDFRWAKRLLEAQSGKK